MTWIDQILKINNRTEIETIILTETDKAVQIDNTGRKVWLPKKLISIKPIENISLRWGKKGRDAFSGKCPG